MFLTPQPLHIPDGFLSIVVDLLLWVAASIVVG
jgi:ABC-type Co2+ transport system permease subunit